MQIRVPASQTSHVTADPCAAAAAQRPCFFSAHAYCREFDDGAVILDLRGDTYLGIDAQHLPNLRARIGNWPDSGRGDREAELRDITASDRLITELLAREILTTAPTVGQPGPATDVTGALTVAGSAEMRGRIPLAHAIDFIFALLMVALRLKRSGLAPLVDWLRRSQFLIRRGSPVAEKDIVRPLASFLWLRTWCYTAQRHCLFDSLVLSVYLSRRMIPCALVIGVATKPFLAHAWVQIGPSVLNDTAEHVLDYKCILSVGGE